MSVLPTAVDPVPASAPKAGAGWWRRHRAAVVVVAFLVLAVVVAILTRGEATGETAPHDPANAGPDGAQAVARVLSDEGVDVEVVRSADDLAAAGADASATVVVTSTEQLGTSTVERLLADTAGARVVVVDPGPELLDLLGVGQSTGAADTDDPIEAGCTDPLVADLRIEVDDATRMPTGPTGSTGSSCFDDTLVLSDDLALLGAPDLLTNDQVLRADNAAVALRLLGQQPRLVWYVASYDDLVGDDGVDFTSLLPDWIAPGIGLLALAGIALVLWRGRRLGPLAVEPLPVVVKAIETTRSRGRLYRRSGDRAHAAETLRAATRARVRERLRLGASTDEATLVRDVARHTGRPEADVAALLTAFGRTPADDHDLIALAHALTVLEEEVRRA